jgi:hypothetical protein
LTSDLFPVGSIKFEVAVTFVVQRWDFVTLISKESETVDGLKKKRH